MLWEFASFSSAVELSAESEQIAMRRKLLAGIRRFSPFNFRWIYKWNHSIRGNNGKLSCRSAARS